MMKHKIKNFCLLYLLGLLTIVGQGCSGKQQPEEKQEAFKIIKFSDALQIAEDMGKWLRDPGLEAIKTNWTREYEAYFRGIMRANENRLSSFGNYGFNVAEQSFSDLRKVVSSESGQMRGGLPVVRVAFYKAIKAIAEIEPNALVCLEATEAEINKIGGGCASGACPFISLSQVKPENEKIKAMVACAKDVLSRVSDYNQEIREIAKKGCEIADEAEELFKQQTNNYDVKEIDAHLLDLLEQYAKAIAMLTIALKEIALTHPDLKVT